MDRAFIRQFGTMRWVARTARCQFVNRILKRNNHLLLPTSLVMTLPRALSTPGKRLAVDLMARLERLGRGTAAVSTADLSHVRDFLFLQYEAALGTVIHATPVFEALRAVVPDAHIVVACAAPTVFEVLRHSPFIDRIVKTPDPYAHLFAAAVTLRRDVAAAAGPRAIITTAGSARIRVALLGMLAGGIRIGFTSAPKLYAASLAYDPSQSQIANNLRVVDALGHAARPCEPSVFFTAEDLAAARRLLSESGIGDAKPRAILITQVSGGHPKQWRADRFIAVCEQLRKRHGAAIIFVGTGSEAAGIERIREHIQGPSASLAGRTSIPVLSALLCLCDLAVSLDTGPMHIARAATLPLVVIAPALQGVASPAIEWLPLNRDNAVVFRGPDILKNPADYWIDEVSVTQVNDATDRLLEKFQPSPQARESRVRRNLAEARC